MYASKMKLILPTELADAIQPRLPDNVSIVWTDPDGKLSGDASDAQVYFNGFRLKPTTLPKRTCCRTYITLAAHLSVAGVNHILTPTFMQRDIILTNSAGVYAIPIAEFVLAFILNHAKQLFSLRSLQALAQWRSGS